MSVGTILTVTVFVQYFNSNCISTVIVTLPAVRHDPAKIYGMGNAGPRPKSAAAKLSELRERQRRERLEREKVVLL